MTVAANDGGRLRMWTIGQTAQALQISKRTVYRLIDDGELLRVKIGGAARVPIHSVLEYVRRQQHGDAETPPTDGPGAS